MDDSRLIFKATRWHSEIIESLGTFYVIHGFILHAVQNPDVLPEYTRSRGIIRVESGGDVVSVEEPDPETLQAFADDIQASLRKAIRFYEAQMVVLGSTYVELILADFLSTLFLRHPERMYNFLQDPNGQRQRGMVSLKEITKATSLPDLIAALSEQATATALKGRFKAQLANVGLLTKESIPEELQRKLIRMVEQRNAIVHEANREPISEEDVKDAMDGCLDLVDFLAGVAHRNRISIDGWPI